jgi:hypothetical protein
MERDASQAENRQAASAGPASPERAGEAAASRQSVSRMTRLRRHPASQLASVLLGVGAITAHIHFKAAHKVHQRAAAAGEARDRTRTPGAGAAAPPRAAEADEPAQSQTAAADDTASASADVPAPEPVAAPIVDQADIAQAEAELDAASRDRARAEARATNAARRLAEATAQAALETSRGRKLAFLVRDPSTRIAQASTRGGFLRGERDKLAKDVSTLRQLPRPKLTTILGKSPVAKPVSSEESHFELRRGRVSFIDIEGLMALVKADAQVRIRMSDRVPVISSQVGPIGSFSLAYELAKALPNSVEELLQRKSIRFDLRAWEVIATSENRGETYEATRNPISEFTRAINRISPSRATVTFWVYPDSFGLYRRLRADLVARGFSVAGRPLPDGMTIRGSPMGTQSAAQ